MEGRVSRRLFPFCVQKMIFVCQHHLVLQYDMLACRIKVL